MNIKPVQRISISEQVYEQLREELLKGVWKTGEKLPSESELAKLFGVSRVTIRQALQKLTVLELIETKLGEGSFAKELSLGIYMSSMVPIVDLNPAMLNEVLEFRQTVEVKTAGLCAIRADETDVEKLEKIYQRMQTHKNNVKKFSEADLDFHVEIAKITRNSLIIETHKIIRNILETAMIGIVAKRGPNEGLYFHSKLLAAIAKGDSQEAIAVMESHLQDTCDAMGVNSFIKS